MATQLSMGFISSLFIQDPILRPLDELFIDHFMQGLFKHVRGAGESEWAYEDYEDAFGDDSYNFVKPRSEESVKEKSDSNLHLRIACLIIGCRSKTHQEYILRIIMEFWPPISG